MVPAIADPAVQARRIELCRGALRPMLMAGDIIGGFHLEMELGGGGMGVVFRARGPNGQPVAVKVMRPIGGEAFLERFTRESKIRIDHPNVVRIVDAGSEDGVPYIALELLEGEPLARRLSVAPLPPLEVVEIGVQVCRGLAAVHAAGVVHRDLKPGNLFRTTDGTIKVLDFGVAAVDLDVSLTLPGQVLGTPSFVSPEQARSDDELDARSDLWSLGAVLYKAATGVAPFARHDTPAATLLAVVKEPLVPIVMRNPGFPPALAAVIERALMKPREERWPNADAFREALENAELDDTPAFTSNSLLGELPGGELLLGRETELAQLRSAFAASTQGRRAVTVLIHGPAGIGKSRLRRNVQQLLQERDCTILSGRAEPISRDRAFSLFASAMRASTDAPTREERDPQSAADRARLEILEHVTALAQRGPLALLFEDLQWADAQSLQLLGELLDRLEARPVFCVLTARPEFLEADPARLAGRELIRVEPRPLSAAEAAHLARSVAGQKISDKLAQAIAERTDGNPFFIEQMSLALEDERFAGEPLDAVPLPAGIEALVQSRLDRLPREEQELVKRAAIFARPFVAEELQALGVERAEPLLASLVRRDLLRRTVARHSAKPAFRFHGSLVAEVAYRMLGDAIRVELHQRAAELLARSATASPEEIARHHEAAGEQARAAERYAEASRQAAQRGDSGAVLTWSKRALQLGLEEKLRFQLFMDKSDAYRYLGRCEEQAVALAAACALSKSDAERAQALAEETQWLAGVGRVEEALETAAAAVIAARSARNGELLAIALGRQAMVLIGSGRVREAALILEEASALAEHGSVHLRADAAGWRALLASAQGDLGRARDAFRASAELYALSGDVRRAAGASCNLADTYNRVGAYAEAETALREALEACRRAGHRVMAGYALANLGYALMMQGRIDETLASLDEAVRCAEHMGQARLEVMCDVYRARALLGFEDPREVRALAGAAADAAERVGAPALRVAALTIAARASLELGDKQVALELSAQAMLLRADLGGVEEDEADVFLTHVEALIAVGRRVDAKQILLSGRRRLERIASGIADEAWRRRFLRDVPAHRFILDGVG